MTVDATQAAAGTSAAARSGVKLAADFDSFLQLLTTQLTTQDPLSPMDAEQFTSQLVQFSSVEQAIQTNTKLETLIGLMQASQTTAGPTSSPVPSRRQGTEAASFATSAASCTSVISIMPSAIELAVTPLPAFSIAMWRMKASAPPLPAP